MFYYNESLGREENKQIRLLYNELLPAAKNNIDSQRRTFEGKSWVPAFEDTNYGGQKEDTKLSSPFLVYDTENKEYSLISAKRHNFKGEMAAFESAVQAVSNRVNKQNNFKMPLDKRHEKLEDFSDEPAEKKRKEKKML